MKRLIGKIFMTIGLVIILSVLYINYNVSNENKELVKVYKELNSSNTKEVNKESIKGIVGILTIPSIDLEVVVKEGVSSSILDTSVGMFKDCAMPGEIGNFAIAGHRNYTSNKFFSNLDKVSIGDELLMQSSDKQYKYLVDSIDVVEPSQIEVLDSSNKKEITLITCTPKYVGSHRLVVKGELVK